MSGSDQREDVLAAHPDDFDVMHIGKRKEEMLLPGQIRLVPLDAVPSIKRDLAHVPTDKLKSLAETYERKLKIVRAAGGPEAHKLEMRWTFVMTELGSRQIVEDVEADLAKVGQ